ncbi:MAG: MGH1-like glycoside hydrolase domain-containing protein [Rhodospirillales bacterium]
MNVTIEAARSVRRANDRGGYTVPTARLYPYQWNWDSAFVAMGWITFDEPRAWRELERLLEGQWDDGMVPHIIFHAPADTYFPGPDVWRTAHTIPTSGITQPPVLATAVRRCLDVATDRAGAEARAAAIYPRLLASHRWWAAARDPGGTGLVGMLHPWESGMDNSPAWDVPFARVPPTPTTPIRRKDTGHVGADMRPTDDFYRRVIALIDLYAALGWDPARMWAQTPFKVADVGINAILHRAERDLLALAGRFGTEAERAEIADRLELSRDAIAGLWSWDHGVYLPRDLTTGELIPVATSAGFLPLYAGVAEGTAAALAQTLQRWRMVVPFGVPSTDPNHAGFEPKRYWRGPVWAIVNWMIAQGFDAETEPKAAWGIRDDTASLIRRGGFAEYFDPTTGEGLGGGSFTWTAAVALAWGLLED